MNLHLPTPAHGFLPEQQIVAALDTAQLERIREHALALACLDGNAFPQSIDQYIPEAYANLWMNSALGDLPMLYPTDTVTIQGNDQNMVAIMDKAIDVLGTKALAEAWVDKVSQTLGAAPREMSQTADGTKRVLIHLNGISRHYGIDA